MFCEKKKKGGHSNHVTMSVIRVKRGRERERYDAIGSNHGPVYFAGE